MTLSATGEAETPAGGSVCMRCTCCQLCALLNMFRKHPELALLALSAYLEVAHQAAAGCSRHDGARAMNKAAGGRSEADVWICAEVVYVAVTEVGVVPSWLQASLLGTFRCRSLSACGGERHLTCR